MSAFEILEARAAHGGRQLICRHASRATGGEMTLSVFLPPQANEGPRAALTYLSGLTCTHANVTDKGEFRRTAAELGLIIICPDTSPRGEGVPDDPAYDLGQGAGFYLDARRAPWSAAFRMETYIAEELPDLIATAFPVDPGRQGVFGHSMGGHGALTLALRHPTRWRTTSAFAPIAAPSHAPWGRKAFMAYLGEDEADWRAHDACALIEDGGRLEDLLVDVGLEDPFLEAELMPDRLEAVCRRVGQPLTLRRQPGYDHSYSFVSTFMADHLRWHAQRLAKD